MDRPKHKSILTDLLRILTPEEIDELSKIYLSFFRRGLTLLLNEKLDEEKMELGFRPILSPPPISRIKRVTKKPRSLPPFLEPKVTGGVIFILDEKEKFSEINKKQNKLRSNYSKNLKLSQRPSRGVLVNKKCS
ncbi:MAG: hypothetical protein ACHQYQ_02085 [Bacteriovoracales bacterium]